jgi:hypothetical protein
VTFQPQIVIPISPTAALGCGLKAFQIYWRQGPATVDPVVFVRLAGTQRWHLAYLVPDRSVPRLRVRLPEKLYLTKS